MKLRPEDGEAFGHFGSLDVGRARSHRVGPASSASEGVIAAN
jgi:hypothetical protein